MWENCGFNNNFSGQPIVTLICPILLKIACWKIKLSAPDPFDSWPALSAQDSIEGWRMWTAEECF